MYSCNVYFCSGKQLSKKDLLKNQKATIKESLRTFYSGLAQLVAAHVGSLLWCVCVCGVVWCGVVCGRGVVYACACVFLSFFLYTCSFYVYARVCVHSRE
jgi:sterol desaturase/sphingolipid hydroxylase (fatty acid hydroxylase superfamily)